MQLSNKTYDILKWVITIVLPALTLLISTIGSELALENVRVATQIMTAFTTFLGTVFMISSINYNNNDDLK